MTATLPTRSSDATLSVTKAARLLGVHPNTIRAWSDQGRLRFYRINARGDRRYRLGDLQHFLTAAEARAAAGVDGVAELGRGRPDRRGRRASPDRRILRSTAALVAGPPRDEDPLGGERRVADLHVLADLARLGIECPEPLECLGRALALLREAWELRAAVAWELRGERLVRKAAAGAYPAGLADLPAGAGLLGLALTAGRAQVAGPAERTEPGDGRWADAAVRIAVPIPADRGVWGVLLFVADERAAAALVDADLASAVAAEVGALLGRTRLLDDLDRQLHQAAALQRIAADVSSKLDLDQILAGLTDHAMVLFGADRAALFLQRSDGSIETRVARNLSAAYLAAVADFPAPSLPADAVALGRPLFATAYRDDPRSGLVRAAVIQEGYDTICCAPLRDAGGPLGLLILYHDQRHPWTDEDLEAMAALATQGAVAIRTAQNFAQMATWAAQLQSIQQLGVRLSRLSSVREIGIAIATELRQLIDYHNVRVYRLYEDELAPVAMQGQVGEYVDETPEQLRIGIGEGLTGWVARHAVAQNVPDAARDPRAMTIPGTEKDLDESMLLAPMLYEDQVLGVLVLSKLGLRQFSDDDLRLLAIYASFAAQAMANADATDRLRRQSAALERQLASQRALLQITESILTTLDPRAVLERITDSLASLVRYDNVSIELYDPATRRLHPLTARGVHAEEFLADWAPSETGLATWVVDNGEPQLVRDELRDERVRQFATTGPVEGSLIVVPLRGREGVTGVLTLERLGGGDRFTEEEFDLVKLFAAQVSIALQNAETHHETEIRAQTDDLTGLLNQGTFHGWLARSVADGGPFSLIMLDLDDFKAVNDGMGHAAGDDLLRRIAAAIVAAGRDSDRVFRYGGDEFTLLLPGTDAAGAAQVAERVRAALHAVPLPRRRGADGIEVSCSMGIATFPDDGASAADVLIAADRACYVAKRAGRDRVALAPEGLALAAEFSLQVPTPVDPFSASGAA